ncbi:cellulose biosynthesis protein BcsD [Rhodovarius lipocyclicus]|uniref:cellulose biosynthesis protein BcsD n=1 Tax=Rhodovarius lipocyclicus TaxID=268410 RepID=UPI00135B367C|nr:cellulose biosynthesis protein BcsD [Rhodovarius lipocyclicus]
MSGHQITDPNAISYLARRGVAAQWRGFLRALVETLDTHLDAASRDALLRAVGGRMAQLAAIPACGTLAELETRMNDVLAAADWGYVQISLDAQAKALVISHHAAPAVSTHHDAQGAWVGAVLEGLYAGWLAAQPGAEGGVSVTRQPSSAGVITLRYGK